MWVGRYCRSYDNVGGGGISGLFVMWVGEVLQVLWNISDIWFVVCSW